MKTNAARILDALGVEYELRTYDVDETDLSANYVARKIGLPADHVFKTILLSGTSGSFLFGVLPGNRELDLKAVAKLVGDGRVEPVPVAKLQELTGYVRGAVTVLGAKGRHPVYVDQAIRQSGSISISAGRRGVQILLKPQDFLRVTKAVVGRIVRQCPATETDNGTASVHGGQT